METKICSICNKELPATTEYFRKQKRGLYGISRQCKECQKIRTKEYRATEEYRKYNREKAREYRAKNPKKTKEINRRSREKNKDKYNETRRLKYKNDPKFRAEKKLRDKNRKRNKEHFTSEEWEKVLAKRRKYKKNASPESKKNIRKAHERFLRNNPDYMIEKDRKRREELHDSYIVDILERQTGIDRKVLYKNKDAIQSKRSQILLDREIRKMLNVSNSKICNTCNKILPKTEEYFYIKNKYFSSDCKICFNLKRYQYEK